jgi:DNA-binding MarR family transcriptional regulator
VSIRGAGNADIAQFTLTEHGQAALERLRAARRDDLAELLEGWSPYQHPELAARLQILAVELIDQDAEKLHRLVGNGPAESRNCCDVRRGTGRS